jgi:hypothetical protein
MVKVDIKSQTWQTFGNGWSTPSLTYMVGNVSKNKIFIQLYATGLNKLLLKNDVFMSNQ